MQTLSDEKTLKEQSRQADTIARNYIGGMAYPTIALLAISILGFCLTLLAFANGGLSVWATTLLIAVFTYFSYTPLHEAVHSNIHGGDEKRRWLNDACGYLGGQLIAVSFTSHRLEHFDHHRNTNVSDKDPDFIVSDFGKGPLHALVTALRFLSLQNTYLVRNYWAKIKTRQRIIYLVELLSMFTWRIFVITAIAATGSASVLEAIAVVLLGYYIGAFFTAYWFAYRPHHPYKLQARFENTSSLIMPRGLRFIEWFWLGQNLHSIHHLYPRVPFYRYRALHREIEPTLRSHNTPIIGIFSRKTV